jgi:hypothetical protein
MHNKLKEKSGERVDKNTNRKKTKWEGHTQSEKQKQLGSQCVVVVVESG